ncbi:hypothetical protein GF407_18840 [candidate division KSB1 bacterium]|nr:hypothetical protein [candidate division KSB1 bacterium]
MICPVLKQIIPGCRPLFSKSLILIIVFLSHTVPLTGYEPVPDPWQIPIVLQRSNRSDTLYFGVAEGAGDAFDVQIDVPAPPPPPNGEQLFFKASGIFDHLLTDLRSNLDSTHTFKLVIITTDSVTLSWDASDFPQGVIPGALLLDDMDMLKESDPIRLGSDTLRIKYTAAKTFTGVGVHIETQPPNLQINIDGVKYTTPQLFDWIPESQHLVAAVTPQPVTESQRYVFESWSHGLDTTHTLVAPNDSARYVADYKMQYYLDVQSLYGEVEGRGWHDESSRVDVSVDSLVMMNDSIRYQFVSWQGDIQNSANPCRLQIDRPLSLVAEWQKQFMLLLNVQPEDGGRVQRKPQRNWFDENSSVTLTAVPAQGFQFDRWTGTVNARSPVITLMMNVPHSLRARFSPVDFFTQLCTEPPGLEILVDSVSYSSPKAFLWGSGSVHELSVPTPQYVSDRHRFVFEKWYHEEPRTHRVTVEEDSSLYTALFTSQYLVDITSGAGAVEGAGWYDDSSMVYLAADSMVIQGDSIRYLFDGWQGDIRSSQNPYALLVDSCRCISVNWRKQVGIKSRVYPAHGGQILRDPDKTWYDENEMVRLIARAASGFDFAGWQGDVQVSDSILILPLNKPLNVSAYFTPNTAVTLAKPAIPSSPVLQQNYPNPFNPYTEIRFSIPRSGEVSLDIFNSRGEWVDHLLTERLQRGWHKLLWRPVFISSGIYFYVLRFEQTVIKRRCLYLK